MRGFLVVQSFWLGHTHQLDGAADKTDILDVLGHVGTGPGKPDPGAVGVRLGEHAVPHVRWNVVPHDEFAAHNAMRLGVAAALILAGAVVLPHISGEGLDDGVEALPFARQSALFRELEALVLPAPVHDPLDERSPTGSRKNRIETQA